MVNVTHKVTNILTPNMEILRKTLYFMTCSRTKKLLEVWFGNFRIVYNIGFNAMT